MGSSSSEFQEVLQELKSRILCMQLMPLPLNYSSFPTYCLISPSSLACTGCQGFVFWKEGGWGRFTPNYLMTPEFDMKTFSMQKWSLPQSQSFSPIMPKTEWMPLYCSFSQTVHQNPLRWVASQYQVGPDSFQCIIFNTVFTQI